MLIPVILHLLPMLDLKTLHCLASLNTLINRTLDPCKHQAKIWADLKQVKENARHLENWVKGQTTFDNQLVEHYLKRKLTLRNIISLQTKDTFFKIL